MRRIVRAQCAALCAAVLLAGCVSDSSAPTASTQPNTGADPTGKPGPTGTVAAKLPQVWSPVEFTGNPAKLHTSDPANFQAEKAKFESLLGYRVARKAGRFGTRAGGGETEIYHLEAIKASAAYARGATGNGEVVAVTDSGVYRSHPELNGKLSITTDGKHCYFVLGVLGEYTIECGPYRPDQRKNYQEHGTAVASLIATKDLGDKQVSSLGVAFGANLNFHQVSLLRNKLSQNVLTDNPGKDQETLTEDQDKEIAKKYFTLHHADGRGNAAVLNHSFAWGGEIRTHDKDLVRRKLKHTIAAMAQKDTPDAEKVIIVRAAGNAGHRSPLLISGLGVAAPELRGHVLAVVATGKNGVIHERSNRCGVAKDFCLAAPGENLPTADHNDDPHFHDQHYLFNGTSAAAPLVSGGLAVLRQYFSEDDADGNRSYQLGNTELVKRLLATADRTGEYANSDIYGHGMMDLDAATAPVGALATALSTDPNARPFDASAFSLSGNAFGGAMRDALGGVKIAAFDELDAPFFFPLADGVSHAPQISAGHSDTLHEHEVALGGAANASLALSLAAGELSAARIRRGNLWFSYGHHGGREAGLYFGDDGGISVANFGMNFSAENSAENVANAARHFRAPLAFASPYLSLVRDGPGLGWSQPLRSGARFGFSLMHGAPQFDHFANPGGARGLGALFDFRPNNTSLSLQAGAVREADGFLGARAQGNFGEISADTAFAGIGGDWAAMQNWRLLASAYLGHTKADTGDGMLRAADDIVSSAFSLGLARAGLARRGDWLGLRLSQPLRAESGAAHLRIPAGRTKYREVLHRQHKLELTPSGRNLQVEAEYRVPFAGGNLRAGLGFDRHANHDRARDLEGFLRLGFERRF